MTYKVKLAKSAKKKLLRLDKPVREAPQALFDRLETLDDPHAAGKAVT